MPSTPVGIEEGTILDDYLTSSSVLDGSTGAHLARLNEVREFGSWCTSGPTANEWLQVFLGKQYTLTHIALQRISGGYDVTALTLKYEKTKEGVNWMTYSKLINGTETAKVIRLFYFDVLVNFLFILFEFFFFFFCPALFYFVSILFCHVRLCLELFYYLFFSPPISFKRFF